MTMGCGVATVGPTTTSASDERDRNAGTVGRGVVGAAVMSGAPVVRTGASAMLERVRIETPPPPNRRRSDTDVATTIGGGVVRTGASASEPREMIGWFG